MTGEEYWRSLSRNMKATAMLAIILLLFFGLMTLKGCATLTCNEVQGHASYWASWEHAKFSMGGYEEFVKLQDQVAFLSMVRIETPIDSPEYALISARYKAASDKMNRILAKSLNEDWWGCPVEGEK